MKINLKSKEEFYFEPKEDLKVGTMRVDFDNRYNGPLCNKWFPSENVSRLSQEGLIDLKEIQQVVNIVQFEMFNTFDKIVKFCGGTDYDNETWRFFQQGSCNYILKFIPVVGDYNMYIFAYAMDGLEVSI